MTGYARMMMQYDSKIFIGMLRKIEIRYWQKLVCMVYCQTASGNAGMAELADARDLKSRETHLSYRFKPGFRHQTVFPQTNQYRGVEQLVARRAHNPEVVGSSPSPATKVSVQFRCTGKNPRNHAVFGVFSCQNSGCKLKDADRWK